ncbi:hypothetical protein BC833DRAFT_132784, partial [Globomyces pollinis-pini]
MTSVHTDDTQGLNIIIPIGRGVGSSFQKLGYRYPTPFINIVGRPMLFWIIDKLSVSEADTIWIAMSKDISIDLQVQAQLRKTYPTLTIKLIPLIFDTCGAAETLFIVCQSMNATELARKTVTLNCDTIYFDDILSS